MSNPLHLIPGGKYRVCKLFIDYDKCAHPVGEIWTFLETHFLPYEDGLILHVMLESGTQAVYRLQWRKDEQAHIIEQFANYVSLCE